MHNNGYDGDILKANVPQLKNYMKKDSKNSFRQLLKNFASDTSFGGISKATLSDGWLRRCLWTLISATCYGFTIYMCYSLIAAYIGKPISTAVDISYEKVSESFAYRIRPFTRGKRPDL